MSTQDEDQILQAMMEQAEKLCQSGDVLLKGQYDYLRARIDALIELRRTAG